MRSVLSLVAVRTTRVPRLLPLTRSSTKGKSEYTWIDRNWRSGCSWLESERHLSSSLSVRMEIAFASACAFASASLVKPAKASLVGSSPSASAAWRADSSSRGAATRAPRRRPRLCFKRAVVAGCIASARVLVNKQLIYQISNFMPRHTLL